MPAINNLHRLPSAERSSFGKGGSTVTTDDLDPWMRSQPLSEDLFAGVCKQVDGLMLLQIDQDRCSLFSTKRPVVHPKNAGGPTSRQRGSTQQMKQRIRTEPHLPVETIPRAGLRPQTHDESEQEITQAIGSTCPRLGSPRKPFD